jgi:D-serine deaminase-like pyridoxal phosphate-dependent protein
VSHPCTTVDRWPYLVEVDAEHRVTGVLPTYF